MEQNPQTKPQPVSYGKIIFYDGMDNDGRCSVAIIQLHNEEKVQHEQQECLCIPLDRKMKTMKDPKGVHYLEIIEKYESHMADIVFLDLAPRTLEEAKKINTEINSVLVIDHHKLTYKLPKKFTYIHGAYTDSATLLTYQYFYGDVEVPYVIKLVNDRDVWINDLQPQTNYFHNVSRMIRIEELKDLITETRDCNYENISAWLQVGKIREKSNQREIKKQFEKLKVGYLLGHKVVYHDEETLDGAILSELGNSSLKLQEYRDVEMFVRVSKKDGQYSYALRSLNGQSYRMIVDNKLNGGGHDNSCGFQDKRMLIREFII